MPIRPLLLDGPCDWWCESARQASWGGAAVAVRIERPRSGTLSEALDQAAHWLELERPGLLPLMGIQDVDDQRAWIYPEHPGASLHRLTQQEQLPVPTAAAIVSELARVLLLLGDEALTHPGPRPSDIFIHADGRSDLAGFAGPSSPRAPAPGPIDQTQEARLVYRLGLLLAELLSGAQLPLSAHITEHELALRRLLIRVMSRPGPVFSERYRDCLTALLAWDPSKRPTLQHAHQRLLAISEAHPGLKLEIWALTAVPKARGVEHPRPQTPPPLSSSLDPQIFQDPPTQEARRRGMSTLTGMAPLPEYDDITAISGLGPQDRDHAPPESGTIPVKVGPPVEVARLRPRLPAELFSEEASHRDIPLSTPAPGPRLPPRWILPFVALLLFMVGVALSVYLF